MKVSVVIVTALLLLGAVAAFRTLEPKLPAAERGRRLAERTGCFACHGPEGIRGVSNPGRADKTVPNYEGDLMMFAESPEEIRAWIERGVTPKRARSNSWKAERRRGTLRMPQFGRRLSARQIETDHTAARLVVKRSRPQRERVAHFGQPHGSAVDRHIDQRDRTRPLQREVRRGEGGAQVDLPGQVIDRRKLARRPVP